MSFKRKNSSLTNSLSLSHNISALSLERRNLSCQGFDIILDTCIYIQVELSTSFLTYIVANELFSSRNNTVSLIDWVSQDQIST